MNTNDKILTSSPGLAREHQNYLLFFLVSFGSSERVSSTGFIQSPRNTSVTVFLGAGGPGFAFQIQKQKFRSGEVAQWLRTPAALPEDSARFLASTWWLTTICSFSSRGPLSPSGLHGHQACTWYRQTYECNTPIYKQKGKFLHIYCLFFILFCFFVCQAS